MKKMIALLLLLRPTLGSTERLAWKRHFMRNLGISPDMWQVAILDTKIKKL